MHINDADKNRGLYKKFKVERTDGDPKGKHAQCNYFVLDVVHDPFAIPALRAYAKACEGEYPQLAADLREWLRGRHTFPEQS